MSRVARVILSKLVIVPVLLAVVAGGVWWHVDQAGSTQTTFNAQHQLTQISYPGQTGVNALALLRKHATVKTKHYSFGDFVSAINGVSGNGPKYWTLYVNHRESNVGAGAYITNNGDIVTWKLQ
jgi:hypothetical protein